MPNRSNKIRAFILDNVGLHPNDIVAITSAKFNVTRTTVHRHINTLVEKNQLIKSGITANIIYYRSDNLNQSHRYKMTPDLSESEAFHHDFEHLFSNFKENIQDISYYGFTEIFNNAIDHSKGRKIVATTQLYKEKLTINIEDDGMGIFVKIAQYLRLDDITESILQLSKGKLTTNPAHHSGEGLFFSARLFDVFEIFANGIHYYRDNIENDWGIEHIEKMPPGTKVCMTINITSDRNMMSVFKKYQDSKSLEFNRTEILVELSRLGQETLISRSQAKRIILGLEKFNLITLDFTGVRLIGQGFVDEMFRVFSEANPHIKINYIQANEDVEFMIKRSIR